MRDAGVDRLIGKKSVALYIWLCCMEVESNTKRRLKKSWNMKSTDMDVRKSCYFLYINKELYNGKFTHL